MSLQTLFKCLSIALITGGASGSVTAAVAEPSKPTESLAALELPVSPKKSVATSLESITSAPPDRTHGIDLLPVNAEDNNNFTEYWKPLKAQAIAQEIPGEPTIVEIEEKEPKNHNWSFFFTPYAVVPLELSGDSSIAEVTADLDLDLGDILDALNIALFGQFEALYDNRLGFYFNAYYTNISQSDSREVSGPNLTPADIEATAENQQAYFDFALTYRFRLDDNPPPLAVHSRQKGDAFLDLQGGLRVNYLNQTIDFDVSIDDQLDLERDLSLGSDNTWVEPLLRTRFNYAFNEKLAIFTAGEVSGFGIGDMSLSWRALVGVDWIFAGTTSLAAGYTVNGIDYEVGSDREQFGLDVIQHGPFVAFRFRF
ncbi:hypothetical protein [Myxosarcina sp. GI1(2024)]